MKTLKQYIYEGSFDWFTGLFDRVTNQQDAMKTRLGKLPPLQIKDISTLQVSKPLSGQLDKKTVSNMSDSGFNLISKMYAKRKDYFVDKDGKEMKQESLIYVYTPETPLSKDEKYIVALAVKGDKEYLPGYVHLIDFEVSDIVKNGQNIIGDIFTQYIDTTLLKKKPKGITMKFLNNTNDFSGCTYNGKKFQIADETINLIKLEF